MNALQGVSGAQNNYLLLFVPLPFNKLDLYVLCTQIYFVCFFRKVISRSRGREQKEKTGIKSNSTCFASQPISSKIPVLGLLLWTEPVCFDHCWRSFSAGYFRLGHSRFPSSARSNPDVWSDDVSKPLSDSASELWLKKTKEIEVQIHFW